MNGAMLVSWPTRAFQASSRIRNEWSVSFGTRYLVRYLNTVYVGDNRAKISRSKGSLIVATERGKERVPLNGIDGVVIIGGGQATTDALAACADNGVRVAVLRRSGALRFVVGPPRSGNVHLRISQVERAIDKSKGLELARLFVAAKLQNSRRVVLRWGRDGDPLLERRLSRRAEVIGERLARVSSTGTGDQLRGVEGDAARAHFAAMGSVLADEPLRFEQRNRRPPRDPVNAMLGFCYGLLVTEIVGALDAIGLDPQIGYLHETRSGRPALALDMAEEFRPLADRFVVGMVRRRQIAIESFTVTPGGGTYLTDAGRSQVIKTWEKYKNDATPHRVLGRPVERWGLPLVQATLLARHLRGDLPMYPPFVTSD